MLEDFENEYFLAVIIMVHLWTLSNIIVQDL